MKITKGRLSQIIKEEVHHFSAQKKLDETASYVMDIFEEMKKKYGESELLLKLVEYFSDSELMDCFRFISKQGGERNVPLAPQPELEPSPETPEEDSKDTKHLGATKNLREAPAKVGLVKQVQPGRYYIIDAQTGQKIHNSPFFDPSFAKQVATERGYILKEDGE